MRRRVPRKTYRARGYRDSAPPQGDDMLEVVGPNKRVAIREARAFIRHQGCARCDVAEAMDGGPFTLIYQAHWNAARLHITIDEL